MDKNQINERVRRFLDPVVASLASFGVTPLVVSLLGLVFALLGAWAIAKASLFWGGVWLLVSGVADIVDGSLARHRGMQSKFGAFIDSTFDRISELAYLCALIFYYVNRPQGFGLYVIVVICVVLAGSFLTSYTRARLEGLGFPCRVGLMERAERTTLLVVGLLLGSRILPVMLTLVAVGSAITVVQRILYGYRVTRAHPSEAPPATPD